MNLSRAPFTGLGIFMGAMTAAWSSNAIMVSGPLALAGIGAGLLIVLGAVLLALFPRSTVERPAERTREHHDARQRPVDGAGDRDHPARPDHRSARRGRPELVSSRFLGAAVLAEAVGIVAVSLLLGRFGHGDLVMPAIALVVAAHFALFLRAQPHAVHVVTTAIGCLGAGTAILLLSKGMIDADTARAIAGLALAVCCALYGVLFCLLARADARSRSDAGRLVRA